MQLCVLVCKKRLEGKAAALLAAVFPQQNDVSLLLHLDVIVLVLAAAIKLSSMIRLDKVAEIVKDFSPFLAEILREASNNARPKP